MPSLPSWSSTSAGCPPEAAPEVFHWRASRQQRHATVLLAAGAILALFLCALPFAAALPAAVAVAVRGGVLLRRDMRRCPSRVELFPDRARIDGAEIEALSVAWRGPLAFMRWRDRRGRKHWRVWWPDVLPAGDRRRLRLATGTESPSPLAASVAP